MGSKEIFFALMTYGQHGHSLAVFDFKQSDIAIGAKADNQLAQQRVLRRNLAAAKGKCTQELDALGNGGAGASGCFQVTFSQEIEQAL